MNNMLWWQGAVIYQIYPRSFMDSNGDGVGDLPGIIQQFDYIASLGVDAVWISPFFKSPMKDFGYDISDYRDVDPLFGCLDDFDALVKKAHDAGIKVIIDQVLSHTSDQHAWFQQSRQDTNNELADWYVWADPKPDGTPPNNWLSIFGGPAWQWEPRRQQYYLHNFLDSQPDLNFFNPAVRQAVLDNVDFWLQRGVDGFRLDAINFCYHDALLRDNPAKAPQDRTGRGFSPDNPYAYQYHYYNNTRPETLGFIEELRALFDRYPDIVTLGEVSSEDSLKSMAEYTAGDSRLNMAYSFELLTDDFSPAYIRQTIESLEKNIGDGWPCWAISNHDAQRVLTRWGGEDAPAEMATMLTALLGSLRGSVCSYQGEELGLTEADIPLVKMQDPFGINFWPMFKGRDGCRTPMPWQRDGKHSGFSSVPPWLPIPASHRELAVELQSKNADSTLNRYRQFMAWRKQQPALINGDIAFVDVEGEVADSLLAFTRQSQDRQQRLLCCFNLSAQPQSFTLPETMSLSLQSDTGLPEPILDNNRLFLPAYGGFFAEIRDTDDCLVG